MLIDMSMVSRTKYFEFRKSLCSTIFLLRNAQSDSRTDHKKFFGYAFSKTIFYMKPKQVVIRDFYNGRIGFSLLSLRWISLKSFISLKIFDINEKMNKSLSNRLWNLWNIFLWQCFMDYFIYKKNICQFMIMSIWNLLSIG